MLNGKFVSVERVIEGVYRDYAFDTQLDWVDALEWIGECLDLIGVPATYIEKITDGKKELNHPCPILIEDYRGEIPCDVLHFKQAFYKGIKSNTLIPMRRTTDSLHIAKYKNNSPDLNRIDSDYTYKLNNNYVFTSFKEGEVVIIYDANPTDSKGFPLIPDNVKYIKACKSYVASKLAFKLAIQNKMNGDILNRIEQDYYFNVAQAMVAGRIPNIDEMESWKNNFLKLTPNINSHSSAFKGDGIMEQRFNNSNSI